MASTFIALVLFPLLAIKAFMNKYEGNQQEEFFNIRQTTTIKGIMIMIVFFHHYSHIVPNVDTIELAYRIGQVCICVFFFISGYATFLGYSKSASIDLKKVWQKRAWRLYLPVTILGFFQSNFINAILIFLLASDLAFIFFKTNTKRLLFITAVNILYFVACILIGLGEWWYDDVLTFALGAAFAIYKDQLVEIMKNKKIYTVAMIGLCIACVPFMYMGINYMYFNVSVTIYSFLACIVVVLLMMKVNVTSSIFYFLGQYTWEIFLTHQMFMVLFNKIFTHNILIMVCSFAASVGFSVLLQSGVKRMRSRFLTKANSHVAV